MIRCSGDLQFGILQGTVKPGERMSDKKIAIPPLVKLDPVVTLRKRPNLYLQNGIARPDALTHALVEKWQQMKTTDTKKIICNPWGCAYAMSDPYKGEACSVLAGKDLFERLGIFIRTDAKNPDPSPMRVECAESIITAFSKTVILYEKGQAPHYIVGASMPPAEITEHLEKDTALAIVFET